MAEPDHFNDEAPRQETSARRVRPRRDERRADETPWRVEGAGEGGRNPQLPGEPDRGGLRWGRMILALLGVLAVNWLIACPVLRRRRHAAGLLHLLPQPGRGRQRRRRSSRRAVPSRARFRHAVTSSQANGRAAVKDEPTYTAFKTQVPAFGNEGLQALLDEHGVVVSAKPVGTPWWQSCSSTSARHCSFGACSCGPRGAPKPRAAWAG